MSSQERSDSKTILRQQGSQPRAMPNLQGGPRGMNNDQGFGHGDKQGDHRQAMPSGVSPQHQQLQFGNFNPGSTQPFNAHSPNKQGGRHNDFARRPQEVGRGGGRPNHGRHQEGGRGRSRQNANNYPVQQLPNTHFQFGSHQMPGYPSHLGLPQHYYMSHMQPIGYPSQMPSPYFAGQPPHQPIQYQQPRGPAPAPRNHQENKPKPVHVPNVAKNPEAQKKRPLSIVNPDTKEPVFLGTKQASPSSSQEVPVEKKPPQGGPSGQSLPEPPKRHVLSITSPPAGAPLKAAGKASAASSPAPSATSSKSANREVADKLSEETVTRDKAAADKAAADKDAADKAAEEKAAADKAASDELAAAKAAEEEKAAAEKAAREKAAKEKAAEDKIAAEKAAAEKDAAEKAAAKKAAEEAAAKKAAEEEQKAKQDAEAKAEADAARALEEAAARQTEAAAAAASDAASGESNKIIPQKKKGKKALNDKIAEKEAAEKEASRSTSKATDLEAYTDAPARRPEPEVAAAPVVSSPYRPPAAAVTEASSPKSEEAEDWETSAPTLVENKPAPKLTYSKDYLLRVQNDLRGSQAIESWPGVKGIEMRDLLRHRPMNPPSQGRMGGDKWAQKGPLSSQPSGQAPGLASAPSNRPHGVLGGPAGRMDMAVNGGGGDSWRRRDALPPAPPAQRLPALHKAANRFERGKLISENPDEEARQKTIKSLLNKVTPEKYNVILEKLLQVKIPAVLSLSGLIDQVYEKGVTEPTFTELYARLCYDMNQHLGSYAPEPGSGEEKKITFRRLLLNKCQEEFTEGTQAIAAVKAREQTDAAKQESPLEEGEIKNEAEDALEARKKEAAEALAEQKARYRALGNMQFVGFLYKHRLIAEKIMHECITALLEDVENPRREDIECLCKLITTIGKQLDVSLLKDRMDVYFNNRMKKIVELPHLEARLRFMLQDVFDLRKNNWQERRKVEGPKTIDEIHRDARMEQMAAHRAEFAGSRRSGPMGGGRGGYRDSQPPVRPPQSLTRRNDDRLEAPPRPMQRIPSQEAFAPGGRAGGFRPGGMLSSRNASPATRDQAPPAAPAHPAATAAPSAAQVEVQPAVEPPQAAGQTADDEKWDDFLIQYSAEQDLPWAKNLISTELVPRYAQDQSQIFSEILAAAVDKKEVKQGPTEEILHHIAETNLIPTVKMLAGLSKMLEALRDVDAPFAPSLVGNFGGALVAHNKTSMKELCKIVLEVTEKVPEPEDEDDFVESMVDSRVAIKVLAALLNVVADQSSKEAAKSSWEETGLDFNAFVGEMDRRHDIAALREKYKLEGIL